MVRLLVVTRTPSVMQGLMMRFAAESDLLVVGQSSGCAAALDLVGSLAPDVVLVDTELLTKDETRPASALPRICQQAPVIILSMRDDALARERAETASAAAFVAKLEPVEALLTTIREVAQRRQTLSKGQQDCQMSSSG